MAVRVKSKPFKVKLFSLENAEIIVKPEGC